MLGAGLDSFASRSRLASQIRVFEIDYPATQEWKRRIVPVPENVNFVPVDFTRDSLRDRLRQAAFDFAAPAFVGWLGTTMYLQESAIEQTRAVTGGFAPGSEIVVDCMLLAGLRDAAGDSHAEQVGQASAERGEPWLSLFAPDEAAPNHAARLTAG